MGSTAGICLEPPISIRARHSDIPEMWTPEWREYVLRPEYREMLHDQALEDNEAWNASHQPLDIPVRELGATGLCSFNFGHRDFRERFAPDHPDRMDYEESVRGMTEADLMRRDIRVFGALNQAVLARTTIDR